LGEHIRVSTSSGAQVNSTFPKSKMIFFTFEVNSFSFLNNVPELEV